MKLARALFFSSICMATFQSKAFAEERKALFLRAFIAPAINTRIKESKLSPTQSLWLFSSQMNSRYPSEGQKFEVEGLDQSGIESHIKTIVGSDRTIQYEILISRLKSSMPENKPIFLKISAN